MFIYCLKLESSIWSETDLYLLHKIPKERRKKCMRYRFDKDRRLCLYSMLLLLMEVKKITNLDDKSFEFTTNEYGKPMFKTEKGIYFNFSHSQQMILCAISTVSPIGADVEYIKKEKECIIRKCFHQEELNQIWNLKGKEKIEKFYEVWTKKEAWVKCKGTGICMDLRKINTDNSKWKNRFYTFFSGNYICTICMQVPEKINIEFITEAQVKGYWD